MLKKFCSFWTVVYAFIGLTIMLNFLVQLPHLFVIKNLEAIVYLSFSLLCAFLWLFFITKEKKGATVFLLLFWVALVVSLGKISEVNTNTRFATITKDLNTNLIAKLEQQKSKQVQQAIELLLESYGFTYESRGNYDAVVFKAIKNMGGKPSFTLNTKQHHLEVLENTVAVCVLIGLFLFPIAWIKRKKMDTIKYKVVLAIFLLLIFPLILGSSSYFFGSFNANMACGSANKNFMQKIILSLKEQETQALLKRLKKINSELSLQKKPYYKIIYGD